LASAAVVGAFDPGDDREPEVLAGGPAAAVQHVVLEQGEEGFHGGVVAGGDLAHRTGQVMVAERGEELPGPELRSADALLCVKRLWWSG